MHPTDQVQSSIFYFGDKKVIERTTQGISGVRLNIRYLLNIKKNDIILTNRHVSVTLLVLQFLKGRRPKIIFVSDGIISPLLKKLRKKELLLKDTLFDALVVDQPYINKSELDTNALIINAMKRVSAKAWETVGKHDEVVFLLPNDPHISQTKDEIREYFQKYVEDFSIKSLYISCASKRSRNVAKFLKRTLQTNVKISGRLSDLSKKFENHKEPPRVITGPSSTFLHNPNYFYRALMREEFSEYFYPIYHSDCSTGLYTKPFFERHTQNYLRREILNVNCNYKKSPIFRTLLNMNLKMIIYEIIHLLRLRS